ncbi:MAG: YceI family protein [Arachidicoccus sp.]|nr:YceI family protein [Arachidicoccus sp.]
MKKTKVSLLLLAGLISISSFAQNNYKLSTGYSIIINGGSNLHDWKENASSATGTLTVNSEANGTFSITDLNFNVNAKLIKSSEGSIMDNKTFKALNTDKYPSITFKLTAPVKSIPSNASGFAIAAAGTLTIAGVSKPATLHAKITASGNKLEVTGSQPIAMSNYGIEPPKAMLGALKVKDNITVDYKTDFVQNN